MTGSDSFPNALVKFEQIHSELQGGASAKAAYAIHNLVFES